MVARFICIVALGLLATGLIVTSGVASPGVGAQEAQIDFSGHALGHLDPLSHRADGLVFDPQSCGTGGCSTWFVGYIQGDNALVGNPLLGGVYATFTRPISELSLTVAPALQGTAVYTLTALAANGAEVATQSLTVTQDSGDPSTGPDGYFTISLDGLPAPAKSFILTNSFVRSSFPILGPIAFGVSGIRYRHWVQSHVSGGLSD